VTSIRRILAGAVTGVAKGFPAASKYEKDEEAVTTLLISVPIELPLIWTRPSAIEIVFDMNVLDPLVASLV